MDFLALLVFEPLVAGFGLLILSPAIKKGTTAFYVAIASSLLSAVFFVFVLMEFGKGAALWSYGSFSEIHTYPWLPQLGINLTFGVDGISLPLILLTIITMPVVILSSRHDITQRETMYYSLLLITEGGVLGVFTTLDLFVFFVFWEAVLIPMFFLIGIWGGPRREYSAYKFLIYTHVGSVVMLIAIFLAYFSTGSASFSLLTISKELSSATFPAYLKDAIFGALVFGFLVKMPVFPFHTWLPDAHVEAPSPVSVVLAGLLLKMGGYGMIRLAFEMIPSVAQSYAHVLLALGVTSAVYGAFVAYRQTDIKRMVALSSISHMGFVLIGISTLTPVGIVGSVFQMFSHGIVVGSLFLLAGFIGESTGTRQIPSLSGLARLIPKTGGLMTFAALAAVGLPGLSGFVGEYMIIWGALSVNVSLGLITASVMALTAGYFMWTLQRMIFSKPQEGGRFHDLPSLEVIGLSVFVIFMILVGIYPLILQQYIAPAVKLIVNLTGW